MNSKAFGVQNSTHFGFPPHRWQISGKLTSSFHLIAPNGHAITQDLQAMHKSLLTAIMPNLPVLYKAFSGSIGHASMQGAGSHLLQIIGMLNPSL